MSRTRIPLDAYDKRPPEMDNYLSHFGWHMNKKLTEFAISKMRKLNPATNKMEKLDMVSKDKIDEQMKKYGIVLKYNELHDYIYMYHMAMADFYKSSLPTEEAVCKFVCDYVDDPDQVDGFIFNRWYADMTHAGIPVDWSEML